MEKNTNLYQLLERKREYYSKFKNNQAEGLYYIYIIGDFIPRIIESYINRIGINNILTEDIFEDIYNYPDIYVFTNTGYSIGYNWLGNNDTYVDCLHLSKEYGEKIKKMLDFSLRKYGIGEIVGDKITIVASLKALIEFYESEYMSNPYRELNPEPMKSYMPIAEYAESKVSSRYADYIHSELFESTFLDGFVYEALLHKIYLININNYDKYKNEKINVYNTFKFHKSSISGEGLAIEDQEYDEFLRLAEDFLKFYGIGHIEKKYGDIIGVSLSTNLQNLLNAYYQEKQRIKYYTNENLKAL